MSERRPARESRAGKTPRPDAAADADGDRSGGGTGTGGGRSVGPRRERYLVAPLPLELLPAGASVEPLDPARFVAQLDADPATTVCRVISGRTGRDEPGPAAVDGGVSSFPDVIVVEMDLDRAVVFDGMPNVHIEPDLPLQYAVPEQAGDPADPGLAPLGADVGVPFEVCGTDGRPLRDAEVFVMSDTFPVRGTTDGDGRVVLPVPAAVLGSVIGLYVKPKFDYWSTWHPRPDLLPGVPNLVVCPSLADSFPGFPASRELSGWAREALRVDALPPTFRGHGVKVCVVDSGAAVDHPDLAGRFAGGRDVTTDSGEGWRDDTMGHGSHCAGIIGGSDDGTGIRGIAPEAELHSCKVFPGGRFSDLIAALDYCVAHRIDVVNLSLGAGAPSELITRKIEQARQSGVACVVAAGNTAGPVPFPASLPNVLTVAAVGRLGVYPPGSHHATQEPGLLTPDGYYSARFTCFGPEVDVVAPGVAVVSSVPPANYAAWDGTSFAGPCVAGLAALILAHHPDFRTRFATRDAARVDRLFDIVRDSCRPLLLGDPGRSGAGLPDATVALSPALASADALAPLRAVLTRAGLLGPAFAPPAPPREPSSARRPGTRSPDPDAAVDGGTEPDGTTATAGATEPDGTTAAPAADQDGTTAASTAAHRDGQDPLAPLRDALSGVGLLPAAGQDARRDI